MKRVKKEEQEKNKKEKVKKEKDSVKKEEKIKEKKINKNVKKAILISLVTVISLLCVVLITIFSIYFNFNYKLYKRMINENERGNKNVEVTYKFKTLVLSKKNSKYIKENEIELKIRYKNYAITLDKNALPRYVVFNIHTNIEKSSIEEFKDLDVLSIDFSNFKFKENVSNFQINIDSEVFTNKNIDIYKINNSDGKVTNVAKAKNIEGDKVSFSIYDKNIANEENSDKYFLVYVPLQDIVLSKNSLELKRTLGEKIDLSIVPENATNKEVLKKYDEEALDITEDFNITTKKEGEHKIEFSVKDENIKKEVIVKVLEVVSSIELDKTSLTLELGKSAIVKANVVPENAVNKDIEWTSTNESIATVNENGEITTKKVGKCEIKVKTKEEPIVEASVNLVVNPKPVINLAPSSASSSNGLTYIQGILVVNKKYSVPSTYNPGVNGTALAAFNQMKAAALNEGISLWIVSGFRSYTTQDGLYNRYVSQYGQAVADTFSAKPGHSEHQTGLAFDLNSIDDNFGNTKEGIWLARKLS